MKNKLIQECEKVLFENHVEEGLLGKIAAATALIELGMLIKHIHEKRDICVQACSHQASWKDPKKEKICLAKCRIEVYKRAVRLSEESRHKCSKAKHPDICRFKFDKFIDFYKDRLFKQEHLLKTLTKQEIK